MRSPVRDPRPSRAPDAPLAFFDSGVGGLTVLRACLARRPLESTLYVADQAHVPYGGRALDEIQGFARDLTGHAFAGGAKLVIMACNVSSATYAPAAAATYGANRALGVVDPGARAAARTTRRGRIGVLATEGTVASGAYPDALGRLDPDLAVTQVACPLFVPLVEAGRTDGPEADAAVHEALAPLRTAGVDVAVLGCTHYPFLLPALRRAAPDLLFVDPAEATAEAVDAILAAEDGPRPATYGPARHRWSTTGPLEVFAEQVAQVRVPGARPVVQALSWPLEASRGPRPLHPERPLPAPAHHRDLDRTA